MTEKAVPEPRKTVIAALYESGTKSHRLVVEIPLDVEKTGEVLVPDSGRYLVVRGPASHGCFVGTIEGDTLVTIYDAEGARIGALKVEDVFTPSDVLQISLGHVVPDYKLRHETQDQEVVVLSVPVPRKEGNEPRYDERRIDVATAALLDPKHDIYPVPPKLRHTCHRPWVCGTALRSAIDGLCGGRGSRIDRSEAILRPCGPRTGPEFPPVAIKVRIRGVVSVEVIVSESGDVLCTRNTRLPFGLDHVAVEAAGRWTFRPFIVNGHQ